MRAALACTLAAGLLLSHSACSTPHAPVPPGTHFLVDYRSLGDDEDGVLVIDLDPEGSAFGRITSRLELGKGVLPHHLYFNRTDDRVYTTALGPPYLYELQMRKEAGGIPAIAGATPIDTAGNLVGEDMFFTKDGRFFVTFMGGHGDAHGGSIGVFTASDNRHVKTLQGKRDDTGAPFLMHPHGLSINEEKGLLMTTSTIHPNLTSEVGNSCTLIDLNSLALLETYRVADAEVEQSSPVEVLLLRGEFPPYALVTTMLGGDVWIADHDPATNRFRNFRKFYDGSSSGLGWALELYIGPDKLLYVSFAEPGVVLVFDLTQLPAAKLVRTLKADPGAHHMAFFKTRSGRSVVAVQNNMLNLPKISAGTIAVFDIATGERLATVDLRKTQNILPESIESATGHGYYMHH